MATKKMKVSKTPPVQTLLVSMYRTEGIDGAINHIQGNLNVGRLMIRDPECNAERETFGRLFGKAIKADNPEMLAGFMPVSVDWSRARERWNALFECRHCHAIGYYEGDAPSDENGHNVCAVCVPHFIHSEIQECWIPRDGSVSVRTGASTFSAASRRYAERHCPRVRDEWVDPEYAEEMQGQVRGMPRVYPEGGNPFDPRVHGIAAYHSSKQYVEKLPSPAYDRRVPALLVGIELEIEVERSPQDMDDRSPDKAAREIKTILNGKKGEEHYALAESDGSISHGFEIVTGWTGLDTHERILSRMKSPEFLAIVKKYGLKSHDTTTCGLHVTIDRAGMTPLHRGKFQVFLNAVMNKEWLDKICRRSAARYSKMKFDKFAKVSSGSPKVIRGQEADRYEIANFHGNKYAIEFRGPKGTLRFETIMATMEFIRLVWMFTKQASMKELTADAFMEFMWKSDHTAESQYLRAFLLERKIAPEEHIELPTKRRYTIQESLVDASAMGFIACSKDL